MKTKARAGVPAAQAIASAGETVTLTVETPVDRLDRFVTEALRARGHQTSRAEVQRWFKDGKVLSDGRALAGSQPARLGAELTFEIAAPRTTDLQGDASIPFGVVFEDEHLLVIEKPAHLVVHPARGHERGTLVHGLVARASFRFPADDDNPDATAALRPGIVHRLDKGTSGLMVVAKDAATREGLKHLFATHDIQREYVAIVIGHAEDATLDTGHGRHARDRLRFTSHVTTGRRAITHVKVLERLAGVTLVTCTLETGRTHQIRVHLTERLRTPILGDRLYGGLAQPGLLRELATRLGRPALHARVLGFVHPITKRPMRWDSSPPPDFEAALEALRADTARDARGKSKKR